MKFPSKFCTYKDSSIFKFPAFLEALQISDLSVLELYRKTRSKVENVDEFIDVLDCLFAMKKITLKGEVIHYVEIH